MFAATPFDFLIRALDMYSGYYAAEDEEFVAYLGNLSEELKKKKKTVNLLLGNVALRKSKRAVRYERYKNAKGSFTPEQLNWRKQFYGGRCWMCGDKADTVDHIKPLSKGGSNWPSNLRPACDFCNKVKGGKWPFNLKRRILCGE